MTIRNIQIHNNDNSNSSSNDLSPRRRQHRPPAIITFSDFVVQYSSYTYTGESSSAAPTSSRSQWIDNLGDEIVARCKQRNIPFLPKEEIEELKLLYPDPWEKIKEGEGETKAEPTPIIREAFRNDVSTVDDALARLVEVSGKKYYSWKALIPTKLTEDMKKNKVPKYRLLEDIRYVPGGEYFYDHGRFGGSNYYNRKLTLEKVRTKICKMILREDYGLF